MQRHTPACLIIVKVLCFRSKKEGTKPECLGFQGLSDLVLLSHNNPRYKISISQYNSDKVVLKFKALQIQYSDSFTYFNCTLYVSLYQTLVFFKKTYHCKCYIKNILLVLFLHKVYLKSLCILCILHLNYYSENSIVKDFCHSGHFFDIHVNYACCKAKPLLTVYIMNGQHKICPICPSQANTGKAKRRTQKGVL